MQFPALILLFGLAAFLPAARAQPTEAAALPAQPGSDTAYVIAWLGEAAPGCPPELAPEIAAGFLEILRQRAQEDLRLLPGAGFPRERHLSTLLQVAAAQMKGPALADRREELARQRTRLIGRDTPGAPAPDEWLAKVKAGSPLQHRRVLEGRLDDEELLTVLRKAITPKETVAKPAAAAAKELTAAEIVSEFSRRNQKGAALQRLQAYTIEARLQPAQGPEQRLLLFKMRPERFRLVVLQDGATQVVVSGDGADCWVQRPGKPAQKAKRESLGELRHLGEFFDPLHGGANCRFERLAEAEEDGRKVHRLSVLRPDGSGYVAHIDPATWRAVARETAEGVVRYEDFREVAGLMVAFREIQSNKQGEKSVLEITRLTPNPGIVSAFFEPPPAGGVDYFLLEKLLAPAAPGSAPKEGRP
jgi:hypothetical protein